MINALISFLLILTTPTYNGQFFEGKLSIVQQSINDTTYYNYFVKRNKVRIEEYDRHKELLNYLIVDIKESSIYAVNPAREIFMQVPVKPHISNSEPKLNIEKTVNYKMINGYKCFQWVVKNKGKNTVVSYWVAQDNFNFFEDLLKILNRTEKTSSYFLQIPHSYGYIPMVSVERSLLREMRMRLAVTDIKKEQIDETLFDIPEHYALYDN